MRGHLTFGRYLKLPGRVSLEKSFLKRRHRGFRMKYEGGPNYSLVPCFDFSQYPRAMFELLKPVCERLLALRVQAQVLSNHILSQIITYVATI